MTTKIKEILNKIEEQLNDLEIDGLDKMAIIDNLDEISDLL